MTAFGTMPVTSNWLRITTIIGAKATTGTVHDEDAEEDAEARTENEPKQRGFDRDQGVIGEATLRGERRLEHTPVDLGHDLVGRRQTRTLLRPRPHHEFGSRVVGLPGVAEGVSLQIRVHRDRADVPEKQNEQADDG